MPYIYKNGLDYVIYAEDAFDNYPEDDGTSHVVNTINESQLNDYITNDENATDYEKILSNDATLHLEGQGSDISDLSI